MLMVRENNLRGRRKGAISMSAVVFRKKKSEERKRGRKGDRREGGSKGGRKERTAII